MTISKMDMIIEAIQQGKTNDEIRNEIDGRMSDKTLDKLRANPHIDNGGGDEVKNGKGTVDIAAAVEKIFAPVVGVAELPKSLLKTTGVQLTGLLEYYVTESDVSINGDGVIAATDEGLMRIIDEVAEVREVFKWMREGAGSDCRARRE